MALLVHSVSKVSEYISGVKESMPRVVETTISYSDKEQRSEHVVESHWNLRFNLQRGVTRYLLPLTDPANRSVPGKR